MTSSTSRRDFLAQTATAAYRADLGARDQPFGGVDGDWITVASVLEHATLVDEPTRSELLREAVELATKVVGAGEVQRLAEREWQDRDRSESEAIVILADKIHNAGALNLAATLLDALLDADSSLNVVQRGRVLVKRARIEWKCGRFDEADDRYRFIESLGRRSKSAELRIRAWIGFVALSQKREDFAAVQRFARRAARLAEREGLRKLAREAHSGLMVAAGIDNRFDDALVHGWTVYQLSLGDAVEESGVLGNLGQVLLDAGFNEASRSVFAAVVSRSLPANVMLPALGGLALASAASRQDLTTEWAAREVLRFEPGSVPRYALASALFECGLALTRIGRMKTAMRCRSAALQLAKQYDFSELVSRFERIDGSMSNFRSAATLNKRAASVARELTLLEPRQLPQHVQLAAVSA